MNLNRKLIGKTYKKIIKLALRLLFELQATKRHDGYSRLGVIEIDIFSVIALPYCLVLNLLLTYLCQLYFCACMPTSLIRFLGGYLQNFLPSSYHHLTIILQSSYNHLTIILQSSYDHLTYNLH